MGNIQMEIQQELTQEELEHVFVAFQESINNDSNLEFLSKILKTFVKKITPAKKIHLLVLSKENNLVFQEVENNIHIDISTSQGMIRTCLKRKEPQFTNDVRRYKNYDEKVDNIFDYDLKNLLVMPLQDTNNHLFAILWAGIPNGDLNQYISDDVKHVTQLLDQLAYTMTKEKKEEEVLSYEKVESDEKNYPDSLHMEKQHKVESPILIKKIQTWITGFMKNRK